MAQFTVRNLEDDVKTSKFTVHVEPNSNDISVTLFVSTRRNPAPMKNIGASKPRRRTSEAPIPSIKSVTTSTPTSAPM